MARGPKNDIKLCDLTDWCIPEGKKGRKSTVRQKWAVTIDQRNWTLGIQREGGLFTGQKFAGNLQSFLVGMLEFIGQEALIAANIINDALADLLGRKYLVDPRKTILEIGAEMDKFYGTNLTGTEIDPKIRELLGEVLDATDTEEAVAVA